MQCVRFILLMFCIVNMPTSLFANTSTPVFLVVADSCHSKPVKRYLSGFSLDGYDGVITALHGVVDCDNLQVLYSVTGKFFRNLEIQEVDIENDVALISSSELSQAKLEKLVEAQTAGEVGTELLIVGHPQSIPKKHQIPVKIESKDKILEHLLPLSGATGKHLKERGSPSIGATILSLSGDIQPGHSGAPILDNNGHVVGIGNGGLQAGTVGIGWGIPISELTLTPTGERIYSFNDLTDSAPGLLFNFASEDTIRFTLSPISVNTGEDVTLYFDERIKERFTVYLDERPLPKRIQPGGREVSITVPGDLPSGNYSISLERWKDDPSKSENSIRVYNPYDSFHFSVRPEQVTAGNDVRLEMSDSIGYNFKIYIQKRYTTRKVRLYKKDSSEDRKLIVVTLPKDLEQGDYTFELTSHSGVHRYTSNSVRVNEAQKTLRGVLVIYEHSPSLNYGQIHSVQDLHAGTTICTSGRTMDSLRTIATLGKFVWAPMSPESFMMTIAAGTCAVFAVDTLYQANKLFPPDYIDVRLIEIYD